MLANKKLFTSSTGFEIYYCLIEGSGSPLLFLNGLGDSMECWVEVLSLAEIQRPCLLVDLPGQGASLERDIDLDRERDYALSIDDQTDVLEELLRSLQIESFGIVGFSYGGGVALGIATRYQGCIENLILLLPFILRLDLSFPLSRLWVAQFDFLKALTPKSLRHPYEVVEKSYERFIEHYMNFRYLKRIPDEKHRQVAVQLSRGIMEYNSFKAIPYLPDDKLVVVTSGMDTLVPQSLYQEFWYSIPDHKKRAWVNILDGEHLIIEQAPQFVAITLRQSLSGELQGVHRRILPKNTKTSSEAETA